MKFENYMTHPFPRVRKQMTHPFAAPAHPPILFDQSLKHLVYLVTGSSSILTLYSSTVFAARSRFISSRSSCPKVSCSNTKCFSSSTFLFGFPCNFGRNTMRVTIFWYGAQTLLMAVIILCLLLFYWVYIF